MTLDEDELLDQVFDLANQGASRGDEPFSSLQAVDGEIVETACSRVKTDAGPEPAMLRLVFRTPV